MGRREFRSEDYDALWRDPGFRARYYTPARLALLREVARRAGGAVRLLDAGCGGGELLHALAGPGRELWGVDFSEAACEVARARAPEAKITCAAIEEAALPADYFDAITCTEVLEHAAAPHAIMRALVGCAAPGTTVIVTVPDGAKMDHVSHLHRWSAARLARFLAGYGRVVDCRLFASTFVIASMKVREAECPKD